MQYTAFWLSWGTHVVGWVLCSCFVLLSPSVLLGGAGGWQHREAIGNRLAQFAPLLSLIPFIMQQSNKKSLMFIHMGTDHNLSAKIETHNTWYYHASVQVVMSFLLCPAVSTSFIGWRLAALLREVIRWWGLSSCHQQFHCIGWRRRVTAQRSNLRLTWLVVLIQCNPLWWSR